MKKVLIKKCEWKQFWMEKNLVAKKNLDEKKWDEIDAMDDIDAMDNLIDEKIMLMINNVDENNLTSKKIWMKLILDDRNLTKCLTKKCDVKKI